MSISDTLKKAVEIGDIITIRSSFYTIILSDPGFKTNSFEEALNYVKNANITGLMDEHDGEELLSESEWDDDYFDLLASKLQDNFSEERIEQLKKVAHKLSSLKEKKQNEKLVFEKMDLHQESDSNNTNYYEENKKTRNDYSSSKCNNRVTSSNHIDELSWIGIAGVALVVFWILRHIFKGGK